LNAAICIVVSNGLIAFVRNESDLAAVIAHEIAREQLGHFCRASSDATARVHYGSIVQHFNLDVERAADAEAVDLLTIAGFAPQSMYQVLRCLSERPGAPVRQLAARMRALEPLTDEGTYSPPGTHTAFERIRNLVVEDFDTPVHRCR